MKRRGFLQALFGTLAAGALVPAAKAETMKTGRYLGNGQWEGVPIGEDSHAMSTEEMPLHSELPSHTHGMLNYPVLANPQMLHGPWVPRYVTGDRIRIVTSEGARELRITATVSKR